MPGEMVAVESGSIAKHSHTSDKNEQVKKSRVRVVAGEAGGLHLVTPDGDAVRPTTQRTREAVFNSLASLGLIEDMTVLDLFAGSGAMGIEALSRGARSAVFVDVDPDAAEAVQENLAITKLSQNATVRREGWESFVSRTSETFDLAILDPPYTFTDWANLLESVPARLVVAESGHAVELPARWIKVRERSYGATVVVIAEVADLEAQ